MRSLPAMPAPHTWQARRADAQSQHTDKWRHGRNNAAAAALRHMRQRKKECVTHDSGICRCKNLNGGCEQIGHVLGFKVAEYALALHAA
mgnify:CR=1 FL=1